MNKKIDLNEAKRIAEATHDAYSRNRYTDVAWLQIARRLLTEGASPAEARWVLESKNMRWAADYANRNHSATAADFFAYIVSNKAGTFPWQTLIAEARKETKVTGSDLAGACEGEDIADLIDLARMVNNGVTGPRIQQIAGSLLARIEGRSK